MCKSLIFVFVALGVVLTSAVHAADPSLIGWWKLNDGAGTVAVDSSGNRNDGTLEDDAAWEAEGYWDAAVRLSGGGYVDCGNNNIYNTTDAVTVAAWIVADPDFSYPDWSGIIMRGGSPYDTFAIYYNGPSQQIGFKLTQTSAEWHATGAAGLFDNGWHHVSGTYDGQRKVIYLDGEELFSVGVTGQIQTSNGRLLLGAGRDLSPPTHHLVGLIDDARVYSRSLSQAEIQAVMLDAGDTELAFDPVPADGAVDVPRDVMLGWSAGEFAATHDVYLGQSFEDVNDASRANPMGVLVSQGQSTTTFDPPGPLSFGTTYYWRVDEVNAAPDYTIFKGEVWSFAIEPVSYPIPNIIATSNGTSDEVSTPQRTVDGSGISAGDEASVKATDMWLASPPADGTLYIQYEFDRLYKLYEMLVWNYNVQFEMVLGFGLKGVTVEYSENGTDWAVLGDFEFAKATAKPTYKANTTVTFGGVPAKYVRLNVNSGWGMMGQFGLSEVRFLYIPAQAREPQPADGAVDVDPDTALSWRAGRNAVFHDVYLGTDPQSLGLVDTVDEATVSPGNLVFGSTYYWQIVEVNEADAVAAWTSDIWSFSTKEYVLIDGFETYNDDIEAKTTIFDTWLDGWVNDTGSTVGYFDAPFAEQTIVRSGRQSMPLTYDNSASPFYSEAEREFETAQNWTGSGADTLVLYVRGNATDFVATADGSIVMSAIGTDIWDVSDQFRYAYKSLSGNGSMVVRVDSLIRSNEWAKAGVMIRETLESGSKHAFVAVTPEPAHGISFQRRPLTSQVSANTDVANIAIPHWVKLTRTGNIFTAQESADGVNWVNITVSPALDIQMAANVYIGLAVTSHDAAIVTVAEFSNLSTTGNVTGAWQTAEIGVAQPEGNSSESMYVRIEDSTGKTKTVVNADAAITQRPTWQEWAIPYGDLSGVNLSRVNKMIIGVGSKAAPTAGGAGLIYIDDIQFGHPSDAE